jgi:hypothetical protein
MVFCYAYFTTIKEKNQQEQWSKHIKKNGKCVIGMLHCHPPELR